MRAGVDCAFLPSTKHRNNGKTESNPKLILHCPNFTLHRITPDIFIFCLSSLTLPQYWCMFVQETGE